MGMVTCDVATSLNGYVTGVGQRLDAPFGDGIDQQVLHGWMFTDADEHRTEIDGILAAKAYIMGRNMFSPYRGAPDLAWRGWWGEEPPYHAPVFVLTHHPRDPLEMTGTTFHFVTGGPQEALDRAMEAAGDADVAIAGGAATINQYLALGAIDELRLHVTPMVVSAGERLFDDAGAFGLDLVSARGTDRVVHLTYRISR